MTGKAMQSNERLLQLLADRATEGLDEGAATEVDALLVAHPGSDEFALERAAAAIHLAMFPPPTETLPSVLRDRILTDAGRFVGSTERRPSEPGADAETPFVAFDRVRGRRIDRMAWYLAAASLVLAVLGWWQVILSQGASTAALPEQYTEFVRETSDLVRAPWSGKEPGYEAVSGDVVWSSSSQHGFMRLVDLPPNDPTVAQYQLWIVDPGRDKHPVDGGVFDVRHEGEVVIPIDARLPVRDPKVFAITLEAPGGVVVSGGPLLVVGAVPS